MRFLHGAVGGDPLRDRAILRTRVSPSTPPGRIAPHCIVDPDGHRPCIALGQATEDLRRLDLPTARRPMSVSPRSARAAYGTKFQDRDFGQPVAMALARRRLHALGAPDLDSGPSLAHCSPTHGRAAVFRAHFQRTAMLTRPPHQPMPISAVLLIDLQRDFLDQEEGRMPVDERGALSVLRVANDVLSRRILANAWPILVTNQFAAAARLANYFRNGAAVCGTAGAVLDPRLERSGLEMVIAKASPSAFSNPELERYLHAQGVRTIYALGVFAEGCVRASVVQAVKLGYRVIVIADAVASNAKWKKTFALWAMARAGAEILPSVVSPGGPRDRPAAGAR
jgi:nicotinamidase-related amidase